MTEWGVVCVIIALVGLIAALMGPLTKLTQSITKLTVVVERLQGDLVRQETSAHESHKQLWDYNKVQDGMLAEHERRLTVLEVKPD